ncbi:MAG: hypothetical protein U0821_13150 [Chloroflexota bacterium]
MSETVATARLARDLPGFLRSPISLAEARAGVTARLEGRARRLLTTLERVVFADPRHPYAWLLKVAGCESGDVRWFIQSEGVEDALNRLARAGVYLTFEELKGRQPVTRGSQTLSLRDGELGNAVLRPHFSVFTGGSGGRPTRVPRALSMYDGAASLLALALSAHGISRRRHVLWLNGPVDWLLMHGRLGARVSAWFHPVAPLAPRIRLGAHLLASIGMLAGHRFPSPRHLDISDAERMVRWLRLHQIHNATTVINATASAAVRVAGAARMAGERLAGVTFICEAEPLTTARRRAIESSGARAIANYASMELNTLGYSCAAPRTSDDVHFATDRYAVIQREHDRDGERITSLAFTSLDATEPMICLNVELGDSAAVERRDCACDLGELGLRTHLETIRSFEKMSTAGTTFARGDLVRIVEDVLPARFGGTLLDYQITEEEAEGGEGRLVLRASPDLGVVDEAELRRVLLSALGQHGLVSRSHAALLGQSAAITIRRAAPLRTSTGKLFPIRLGLRSTIDG